MIPREPWDDVVDPSACYHGDSYLSVYHLLLYLISPDPSLHYRCSIPIAPLYLCLHQARPPPESWESVCVSRKYNNQSQGQEEVEKERWCWVVELSLLGSVVLRHLLKLRCHAQAVSLLKRHR